MVTGSGCLCKHSHELQHLQCQIDLFATALAMSESWFRANTAAEVQLTVKGSHHNRQQA